MYSYMESIDSFVKARRLLMLTNHGTETERIIEALNHCYQGLEKIEPGFEVKFYPLQLKPIRELLTFIGIPNSMKDELLFEKVEQLKLMEFKMLGFYAELNRITNALLRYQLRMNQCSYDKVTSSFQLARGILMGSGDGYVASSIRSALRICYKELQRNNIAEIEAGNFESFQRIKQLIESLYISDDVHEEWSLRKIERLSQETKEQLCDDIDSLELYFEGYNIT